jgi:hypothetical protein
LIPLTVVRDSDATPRASSEHKGIGEVDECGNDLSSPTKQHPTFRTVRSEASKLPKIRRIYILGRNGIMIDTFLVEGPKFLRIVEVFEAKNAGSTTWPTESTWAFLWGTCVADTKDNKLPDSGDCRFDG